MSHKKTIFTSVALCFSMSILLSSCAISPQAVHLNPSVTVSKTNLGKGRTVNLKVIDTRPTKALGTRGGIYSDTALVTIDGGPEEPVRQELFGALSAYGFQVKSGPSQTDETIDFTIEIEALGFETIGAKFPKVIKTNILLKAICIKDGSKFTSRYSANKSEEVLIAPTANKNEKTINSLTSKALAAMLKDKKLLNFLQ